MAKKSDVHVKLVQLFLLGKYCPSTIAEKTGQPLNNVRQFYYNFRAKYNFPKPPRKKRVDTKRISCINDSNIKEAYLFYLNNNTLQSTGDKFGGVTRERVRQVFKQYGIKSKPMGWCPRRRKHFYCANGHPLGKGESLNTCRICKKAQKERRKKGLHLISHCLRGHEFTPENIYWSKYAEGKYSRRCRECHRAALKRSWMKKLNR